MIPRIIHYCWFGENEKPEIVQKCIISWKEQLSDFQIIEWNETNFDISLYPFALEAYQRKKWAYVSDIVRLVVLMEYGGIYLDTDVRIINKNVFDYIQLYDMILFFENARRINTGMFCASVKGSELIKKMLDDYSELDFSKNKMFVNTVVNDHAFRDYYPTLKWNNKTQKIKNSLILSSHEYEKYMRHFGIRSWLDDQIEYQVTGNNIIKKFLRNPVIFEKIQHTFFIKFYEFISYDLLDMGILYFVKRQLKKIARKLGSWR